MFVLSDAGILTVFVDIAVTLPLASTVMYGTLNVEPYPGVAFADGPYEPAVAPEVASLSADNVPEEILEAFNDVKPEPFPDITPSAIVTCRVYVPPEVTLFLNTILALASSPVSNTSCPASDAVTS